ncbi:MAG: TIGR04086 family membrane protein [Oscillospiraceae bacterium]|nr:TIGR04086 family membrane protein [Oscillospiraceae bacterium]
MNQYNEISGNIKKNEGKANFQGPSYTKLAKSVTLGTITGLFSSIALMIIFAFIINVVFGDPDSVINIFTAIAASAGAATGGFYASKKNGSKGFISGITTGIALSIVILIIMLFAGNNADDIIENSNIIFKLIIILCQIVFACAGGIFAVNSRKNKRTTRPRSVNKKK